MGFFGKLKNAFSSGSSESSGSTDDGIYIHIKLDRSDEVVRLRLNPGQELNPSDRGYFSRKSIVGPHSFKKAEATFHFNSDKQLVDAEIDGGEMVDAAAWQTYRSGLDPNDGGAGFG